MVFFLDMICNIYIKILRGTPTTNCLFEASFSNFNSESDLFCISISFAFTSLNLIKNCYCYNLTSQFIKKINFTVTFTTALNVINYHKILLKIEKTIK